MNHPVRNSTITLFLALVLSHGVQAEERMTCGNGRIRLQTLGMKDEIQNGQFCFDRGFGRFYSMNCQSVKSHCRARTTVIQLPINFAPDLDAGNPGMGICRQLEGRGESVEFEVQEKWHRVSRCRFESDGSFVDSGTLVSWVAASRAERRKETPPSPTLPSQDPAIDKK